MSIWYLKPDVFSCPVLNFDRTLSMHAQQHLDSSNTLIFLKFHGVNQTTSSQIHTAWTKILVFMTADIWNKYMQQTQAAEETCLHKIYKKIGKRLFMSNLSHF